MGNRKLVRGALVGALAAGAAAVAVSASAAASPAAAPAAKRPAARARAALPASLEALYQRAVAARQTSVVIYGPSAGTDTPLYAAFKKAFPSITVTGVPTVGPPMSAKLAAEFASHQHVADLAYTGDTDMLVYVKSGWLQPFGPSTAPKTAKMPPDTVGPNKTFYGVSIAVTGIVYNTSSVKAKDVPTTWQELLAAKWKNKMAMYDPTAVGEMADVFAHLDLDPQLRSVMPKLKAQNVELFPSANITGPLTAVAQGQKEIGIEVSPAFYDVAKKAGAPVGFKLLKSDNYTVTLYMGQVKGAPDPLASELYEDWLLTPQAATVTASEGAYSPIPGAPSPKGLPAFKSIKFFPSIRFAQVEAADNGAIARSKTYWSS